MASWLGEDEQQGWDNLPEEDTSSRKRDTNRVNRFYLPYGSEKRIVMVSDDPQPVTEHRVCIDNNWFNFFTCLSWAVNEPCPICESETVKASYYKGAAFTAIDLDGWEADDGTQYENVKTLVIAKLSQAQKFKKKRKVAGQFRGIEFLVSRNEEHNSPSIGNDWTIADKMDEDELQDRFDEETIEEYDYAEVFDPMDGDDLQEIVENTADHDSTKDTTSKKEVGQGAGDEDLDFNGVEFG